MRQPSEYYRTSAGFRAQTIYNLPTAEEMNHWKLGKERSWRSSAFNPADVLTYRTEAWFDLAAEPHSEGFFKVIKKLRESADYRAGHKLRAQLTDRVWQMVDAAYLDTRLREDLFTSAAAPTTCADAGAQMFNNLGIKVLASQAYSFSVSAAELEGKLVGLAKGAARLEMVNEIARADVAARDGIPDDVEVHLDL